MIKAVILILLTGLLSWEVKTANPDSSSKSEQVIQAATLPFDEDSLYSPPKKARNRKQARSERKVARKNLRQVRRDFREEHPTPFLQFFAENILPPLVTFALTLSQCK
jgi:hypothetical protein